MGKYPQNMSSKQATDWNHFITRLGAAVARRQPGDPVVAIIPSVSDDGGSATINVIAHHLQPAHLMPIIMHLTDMLARNCPQVDSVKAVKAAVDKHFGSIDAQDVSKGMN
jgi:hypothetical protein